MRAWTDGRMDGWENDWVWMVGWKHVLFLFTGIVPQISGHLNTPTCEVAKYRLTDLCVKA